MIEILKKAKIPIIIILVLILGFIIYNAVFKKSEEVSNLERTSEDTDTGQKLPSQEFLPLLNLIRSVDFDDKFFTDSVFRSMVDFSEPVKEEQRGRENPFSPGILNSFTSVNSSLFEASEANIASTSTLPKKTSTTTPRVGGGQ